MTYDTSILGITILLTGLTCVSSAQGAKPKPLLCDFIGLNVHTVQFKPDLYKPVAKLLRNYHPFEWDVGSETDYAPKFPLARNQVSWESLYAEWVRAGYKVDACLMFDQILPPKWTNLEKDAHSYGLQFARYFGPSGRQNYVESIEVGNEPGKYSDADYRKLFESAASGIRQGDPKLLISTCAVFARKSGDYHKDVATVKGLEPLYDVINVHSYPFLEQYPTWRRSFPEDSRLTWIKDIQDVITWRNTNAPGKQVWLTEFGYDATTKPQEKEGTFSKWVGVTDTQQAQYLVRAFLTLSTLDLDRAYIYWFNDDDKPTLHASSGLTRNYQPKPSFYAVAHLLATLGDYRFVRAVTQKPGEVNVYEFVNGSDRAKHIWAVWSPTGEGRTSKIRLKLAAGRIDRVERMPLTKDHPEELQLPATGASEVELEIGESPAYVHWRDK